MLGFTEQPLGRTIAPHALYCFAMRRFRHLTGQHRTDTSNRRLGLLLAFNAGAINAGGFLVLRLYTSHMTGFVSMLADNLVLGNMVLVLSALGAMLSFISGAALTAILVNWSLRRQLHSAYALPLLIEALLMLVFGLVGAITLDWHTPFAVPVTVLLLSFLMGVQNATVTKMSSSQIRTTHMTGVVTDLGIELGKMLYWNRTARRPEQQVRANRQRMHLFVGLLGMFLIGGIAGALGFKHIGFIFVLPLALVLLALALPPLWIDRAYLWQPPRRSGANTTPASPPSPP